jgi:uncharacterized protein with HEPN domain
MPPEQGAAPTAEDRERAEHTLKAAQDARLIVQGIDLAALVADMIRVRALVNCVTEIGEAASRLSPAGRSRIGELPWKQIVGMRNIVVHVYWGIDVTQLAKTAFDDMPALAVAIERALSNWPASK